MKKILIVFGTRPEAIKMCPVVKELRKREGIEALVCAVGQHCDMLFSVMKEFDISPDFYIGIERGEAELSSLFEAIIKGCDEVIKNYRPDLLLVHGDTSTAFATALAGFYRGIPIVHVEAGLRTNNIKSPFPEEFNRRAISLISDIDLAPTRAAMESLVSEGKPTSRIYITGNTVIDAVKYTLKKEYSHTVLDFAKGKRLLLFTAHRRENIGLRMENIFRAVRRIVEDNKDVCLVYPMHKNPRVREIALRILGDRERILLTEPLALTDMHNVMARSYMIITDSGGIQEEASYLGVPAIVVREHTERLEALESGAISLAGTEEDTVYGAIDDLLCDSAKYQRMASAPSPYGSGNASEIIADILCSVCEL